MRKRMRKMMFGDQSRLEQAESLSFLIVSVYFLSSSQLRYNIKFLVIYNL